MQLRHSLAAAAALTAVAATPGTTLRADTDALPPETVRAIGVEARAAANRQTNLVQRSSDLQLVIDIQRSSDLLDLAEAQIAAKDTAGARETLTMAESVSDRRILLIHAARLIRLQIEVADGAAANAMIDGSDVTIKPILLDTAVRRAAELGNFELAFAIAVRGEARGYVLAAIAAAQCKAGLAAGKDTLALAVRTVHSAPPEERGPSVVDLAEAFAACGDTDGAIAIANELASRDAARNLGDASRRLAKASDFASARVLMEAGGAAPRVDDLLLLAHEQIVRGDNAGARKTLAKADPLASQDQRRSIFGAQIEIEAGAFDDARRTQADARQTLAKAHPLAFRDQQRSIIDEQIEAGAFDDALRTLGESSEPEPWRGLMAIVAGEAKQRATADLERTLPQAIESIRSEAPGGETIFKSSRIGYMAELATLLARAGYNDEAHATLAVAQALERESRPPSGSASSDLGAIAIAEAAVGDSDEAIASLGDAHDLSLLRNGKYLAAEFARRGDVEHVHEVLEKVEKSYWEGGSVDHEPDKRVLAKMKDELCLPAVLGFVEGRHLADALTLARQITDPAERLNMFLKILTPRDGDTGERL